MHENGSSMAMLNDPTSYMTQLYAFGTAAPTTTNDGVILIKTLFHCLCEPPSIPLSFDLAIVLLRRPI